MQNDPVNLRDLWGLFDIQNFYDGKKVGLGGVKISIIREDDGYGNEFNAIRTTTVEGLFGFEDITYVDFIGVNARDEDFAKSHDGMTLPDGYYYYTTNNLFDNKDGSFNSGSYKNVVTINTRDPSIESKTRSIINDTTAFYLAHPAEFSPEKKHSDGTPYVYPTPGPQGAGCTISQNQLQQDIHMSLVNMNPYPFEDVEIEIRSWVNIPSLTAEQKNGIDVNSLSLGLNPEIQPKLKNK